MLRPRWTTLAPTLVGLAALLAGTTAAPAQQTPPVVRVYGSITIGGQNAPAGAVVTAFAGSALCGTSSGDGVYDGTRYFVDIDSTIPACAVAGATLLFQVNGQAANETATVPAVPGGALQVNLSVGAGSGSGAATITYLAGWNLVGAPTGTVFAQAANPLYTLTATSGGSYTPVPNTQGVTGGQGYWAYFTAPTTVSLSASGTSALSVTAPAGRWVMVGNPSATRTVTVSGADQVYTYSPAAGYVATTSLTPGQGAWVLSNAGGAITLQ
jgi:hypothetical protein